MDAASLQAQEHAATVREEKRRLAELRAAKTGAKGAPSHSARMYTQMYEFRPLSWR